MTQDEANVPVDYLAAISEKCEIKTYVHPVSGKVVKIYEMIHVAPVGFYGPRNTEMAVDHRNGFVIHHEGVQGAVGKGLNKSYHSMAESLGWEFQKRPDPTPVEVIDVNIKTLPYLERAVFNTITYSVSLLMGRIARSMKEGFLSSEIESVREAFAKAVNDETSKMPRFLNKSLLDKRNAIALKAALAETRNVSLIWGKAHRLGLEAGLFEAGFKLI